MNAHDKWLQADYAKQDVKHAALQARINDEAESRLIEWQRVEAAGRDAHSYELLRNEMDFIVSFAARALTAPASIRMHEMESLGQYVAAKVQRAAFEVATHACTE